MSVAILRDTSFGNVLKSMESPSLREGNDAISVEKVFGLDRYQIRTLEGLYRLHDAIRTFMMRCVFFNHEAYRLRYGTDEVCEPVTAEQLDALYNMGKVVSRAQLFKTLHCIDYNSDIRDYLNAEGYAAYELRETFEQWQKQLKELIGALADIIAWRVAKNEGCEWF